MNDTPFIERIKPNWIGIAAMAENRVIGSHGRIPWHLPGDFAWFKKVTLGSILLMGRKTFESIGRPLPGRRTIVVSRAGFEAPGVRVVAGLDELVRLLEAETGRIFLCGGGELYRQWLPLCSDLFITHVKAVHPGDAVFPEFESQFAVLSDVFETDQFRVTHYLRSLRGVGGG